MSLAYVPMEGVGELSFSLKPPKAIRKAVSAVAAKLKPPEAVRKVLSVVAPIASIALPVVGGALAATKIGKAVAASKSVARATKAAKTVGDLKKVADTRTAPLRRFRDAATNMARRVESATGAPAPVSVAQQAEQAAAQGYTAPAAPTPVVTTTTSAAADPAPAQAPVTVAQQAQQAAAQGYTAPASAATTTAEPVLTASTEEAMNWTPILIGGGLALVAFAFMAGRKGGRS